MALPPYKKPHASAAEIVRLLGARGLDIPDPAAAEKSIDLMGYTRLRMYLESRCDINAKERLFRKGTTFGNILRIYECDSRLRTVCFEAVGQFEILFRNSISETLSAEARSHPQYNPDIFRGRWHQDNILAMFEKTYNHQVKRDGLAKEYNENYSKPELPPIWYMKEMLTFGDSVTLFESFNTNLGSSIARNFGGLNRHFFRNWVNAFVDLRNVCAHHDRLFNRTFQKDLKILRLNKRKIPKANARVDKLAGLLQCLDHAMNIRGAPVRIEDTVKRILAEYPEINPVEVGYV